MNITFFLQWDFWLHFIEKILSKHIGQHF